MPKSHNFSSSAGKLKLNIYDRKKFSIAIVSHVSYIHIKRAKMLFVNLYSLYLLKNSTHTHIYLWIIEEANLNFLTMFFNPILSSTFLLVCVVLTHSLGSPLRIKIILVFPLLPGWNENYDEWSLIKKTAMNTWLLWSLIIVNNSINKHEKCRSRKYQVWNRIQLIIIMSFAYDVKKIIPWNA